MHNDKLDISEFMSIAMLTAPIWILLLMAYEFFKKLNNIVIYCAWGGAYLYGLCIGAILGFVALENNIVLGIFTFLSSNVIFVLNFMQEVSEYQNLHTLGKIFLEINIFFLLSFLLTKFKKNNCKKITKSILSVIFLSILTISFFQYSYHERLQSIQNNYKNTQELVLKKQAEYRNAINFNLDQHQVEDFHFVPFGKQLHASEKVYLTDEIITKDKQDYALVFNNRAYGYIKIWDGHEYVKEYASFFDKE